MILLHAFLESKIAEKGVRRSTLSAYEADVTDFLQFFRNKKIGDLRCEDIYSYLNKLKYLSSATVARRISSLRQFCNFLKDEGNIKENLFSSIKMNKKNISPSFITQQGITLLLREAKNGESPEIKRLMTLLEILYGTGISVTNLVSLPFPSHLIKNISFDFKIPCAAFPSCEDEKMEPKTSLVLNEGLNFFLNLPIAVLKVLEDYLLVRHNFLPRGQESPWLFPSLSKKGHLTRQRFSQILKELVIKANLDPQNYSLSKVQYGFRNFNQLSISFI